MILVQFELRTFEYASQKSVIVILQSICGDIIKPLRLLPSKYKWLVIFVAYTVSNNHVSAKLLSYHTVF
jgi:hypothetical protein